MITDSSGDSRVSPLFIERCKQKFLHICSSIDATYKYSWI
uniref:Uncharacterized protein n=1 Tax=Triticum urartu TaxID=4572 RepID=A0A8R7TUM8_TRIUA